MSLNIPAVWIPVAAGLIAVICLGVGALNSWLGGWRQLAWAYELRGEFDGAKRRFQSAWMRYWNQYGNCLTVGASPQGLYLACFLPAHPPLLIPWRDIAVHPRELFWIAGVELRFRQAPSVPVRIRRSLADWLRQAAGDAWPEGKQMSN